MRNTIEKHIKENIKDYLILSLILMLGLIVGIIAINNSNETQTEEIKTYVNSFVSSIKDSNKVDYGLLLSNLIKENIKLVLIIAFLSLSVFGALGVYAIVIYKGFCIGYTISSIISIYGVGKGILCSTTLMLLGKIISIPALFFLSISSLKLYKTIINNEEKSVVKAQLLNYLLRIIAVIIILIVSSFVETYINTNLFLCILKYL